MKIQLNERLQRLRARWRIIRNHGDELNRRVTVENVLLEVADGKREMLTKGECRALAYRLGMPTQKSK
jgi:hypothetical protein